MTKLGNKRFLTAIKVAAWMKSGELPTTAELADLCKGGTHNSRMMRLYALLGGRKQKNLENAKLMKATGLSAATIASLDEQKVKDEIEKKITILLKW